MLSGDKISKGGLIGAVIGLIASLFSHKQTDSKGRKAVKTGAFGIVGYLLGDFAEKKIKNHHRRV